LYRCRGAGSRHPGRQAVPDIPILGVDIVPEEKSKKLYVLECNPGGNTWHFSAGSTAAIRRQFVGGKQESAKRAETWCQLMIGQFDAFDRTAEVLVQKVRELAH
jgi:hypothetical protein